MQLLSEMKHADRHDLPLCFHFIHFVHVTHESNVFKSAQKMKTWLSLLGTKQTTSYCEKVIC